MTKSNEVEKVSITSDETGRLRSHYGKLSHEIHIEESEGPVYKLLFAGLILLVVILLFFLWRFGPGAI